MKVYEYLLNDDILLRTNFTIICFFWLVIKRSHLFWNCLLNNKQVLLVPICAAVSLSIRSGMLLYTFPESKVHGANMELTRDRQDPGRPHVGHVKLAIWEVKE